MKKRIDLFWYFFLIIVAFVVCFMFSSTRASAAISSGGSTGNDNTNVVLPDDGIFEPCVSETGCNLTDEAIEQVNLYEECHTYITTNIISNENLVEVLNGKIYTTFTKADCMEMINIASKREVIKNMLDEEKYLSYYNTYSNETGLWTSSTRVTGYNHSIFTNEAGYSANRDISKLPYFESGIYTIVIRNVIDNGLSDLDMSIAIYNSSGTYINVVGDTGLHKAVNGNIVVTINISTSSYLDIRLEGNSGTFSYSSIQIEKGSIATPYVSYDYHREYYQEGIDYADGRVNINSTSYTQGVTDADNRVNTDSTNYKAGASSGYEKANKEGKLLGNFIPSLLGGFGSFFLTLLNIDILGFNLLGVIGILITVLGIVVVIKFLKG